MKIGYVYLFGQEWEEWKKHNKPLPDIIQELKDLSCEKIYMDVFIEDYSFKEIERVDMTTLVDMICRSKDDDQLVIRGTLGKVDHTVTHQLIKELTRIKNLHHRQI